jgi:hypothetical protein
MADYRKCKYAPVIREALQYIGDISPDNANI